MRILQINNYNYIKGGADRVYINTSNLLKKNGHEVAHFSSINEHNIENDFSRYFVNIADNRNSGLAGKLLNVKDYIYNKKAAQNLLRLLKDFKPDIAHIHLFYGGLTSSILRVLKESGIPIVQTIHDYRHLCPANAFLDKKNSICEKCRNRFYMQCSIYRCLEDNIFYSSILTLEAYSRKYIWNPLDYIDHFIFVSDFSRRKHIEFNKQFEYKSTMLYNFSFLPETWSDIRKSKYMLYYGRLSKEKGIITLLKALNRTSFNLKIAGSGPLQKEIESYIKNSDNIEFLGQKSGNELIDLIRNADFIIVPSEWYENNPMTVIEAFSYGKPVIGSEIGGIPEIVQHKLTGLLFESRNLEDLINTIKKTEAISDADYINYSKNARNFAEQNFSPEKHYDRLIDIYNRLLYK